MGALFSAPSQKRRSYRPATDVSEEEFNAALKACGYETIPPDSYNSFTLTKTSSGITTRREMAMFLTQVIHQSGGLQAKCEPNPPDGAGGENWYYGRGYIRLSGSHGYRDASQHIYGNEQVLLDDPDKVSREEDVAWATAFWIWRSRVHNAPGVQDGKFDATSRIIDEKMAVESRDKKIRFKMYKKVLKALNCDDKPCL